MNKWTRADLPRVADVRGPADTSSAAAAFYAVDEAFDAAVEHLNANYPKPAPGLLSSAADCVLDAEDRARSAKADVDRWRRAHEIVEQERDLARRERDAAARQWELKARVERDLAEAAEADRDEWKARAEAAEARTAPAVTKADIEKVVRGQWGGCFDGLTDAVWSLVSGDDPAVHVVRESDVAAVEVQPINGGKWWLADGALVNMCESPTESEAQEAVDDALAGLVGALAARRAIEAGQDADPVEDKARELWESTREGGAPVAEWADAHEDAQAQFRVLARHVLGQEAGDG